MPRQMILDSSLPGVAWQERGPELDYEQLGPVEHKIALRSFSIFLAAWRASVCGDYTANPSKCPE